MTGNPQKEWYEKNRPQSVGTSKGRASVCIWLEQRVYEGEQWEIKWWWVEGKRFFKARGSNRLRTLHTLKKLLPK